MNRATVDASIAPVSHSRHRARRIRHSAVGVVLMAVLVMAGGVILAPAAQADVTTNSKDQLRTGWYPDQPNLSPGLVGGGTFGQQFSAAVDGQVYARPLIANHTCWSLLKRTTSMAWTPRRVHNDGPGTSAPGGTRPTSAAVISPPVSESPEHRSSTPPATPCIC